MTVRIGGPSLKDRVKEALALVETHPDVIDDLTAAQAAAQKAADAEAKRRADAQKRIERDLPARIEALVAARVAQEQGALHAAAARLGRIQLEAEHGLTDPRSEALYGTPLWISSDDLDRERGRLAASMTVPWDRDRRPGDKYRSDRTRAAAETWQAAEVARTSAQNTAEAPTRPASEADHQAAIAARKRAAGIEGW